MTDETCTICGYWRGLHQSDTMHCPANGREDGRFVATIYTEESDELAALRAENAKLREALENLILAQANDDKIAMMESAKKARRALESHE